MGPGIVLFVWLSIAGAFALIWAAAVGLFLLSRVKKWRVLKWLSGLAAGSLTAIGLLIVGLFTYGIIRSMNPRAMFEDTFNRKPASNVRNIETKVFWFADTGSTYLRFETDPDTFRSLVPSDLPRVTQREYLEKRWHSSDPGPDWWTYDFPASAEIHLKATEFGEGKQFASEMTLMAYVPEQRLAYYHFMASIRRVPLRVTAHRQESRRDVFRSLRASQLPYFPRQGGTGSDACPLIVNRL